MVLTIHGSEHAPASQIQDLGADAGVDRDVLVQPRFWNYGAGLYEIEDAE